MASSPTFAETRLAPRQQISTTRSDVVRADGTWARRMFLRMFAWFSDVVVSLIAILFGVSFLFGLMSH